MKAIETCENADMKVIIVYSVSHKWEGMRGILNIHSNNIYSCKYAIVIPEKAPLTRPSIISFK